MRYKILIKERDKMFTYICDEFKRDDKCIEFTDKYGK